MLSLLLLAAGRVRRLPPALKHRRLPTLTLEDIAACETVEEGGGGGGAYDENLTQLPVWNTTGIEHLHREHMRTAPARRARIARLCNHCAIRCAHVVAVVAATALARDAEVNQGMLQLRGHVRRMRAQHDERIVPVHDLIQHRAALCPVLEEPAGRRLATVAKLGIRHKLPSNTTVGY